MTGSMLEIINFISLPENKDKVWDIKEHSEKRSLNANAYFYTLVNKIAKKQRISDAEVHDKFLSENKVYFINEDGGIDWKVSNLTPNAYGFIKEYVGNNCEYYIDSGMEVSLQKEDGDLCKFKDGKAVTGRVFWHIQGTHQMNRKDMSRILSSVVFEAEQLGIEVLTPAEIEHLNELWGKKHG